MGVELKPEEAVEQHLVKRVNEAGGMCIKYPPVRAGIPDRLVILPGGRGLRLVELKAAKGRLRAIQRVFHARALKRGLVIPVLNSKADVDRWLDNELRSMVE